MWDMHYLGWFDRRDPQGKVWSGLRSMEAVVNRLAAIDGAVPDMSRPQTGCRFADRCPFVDSACRTQDPALTAIGPNRASRCIKAPLERLVA